MFKKILVVLFTLLVFREAAGQQRGIAKTLRVKVDANGYLVAAIAAQTNPVTTQTLANARLHVDASGNLVVVVAGGGGAPVDGPYITFTSDPNLTTEQNLGALTTGILLNTVAVGSATISSLGSVLPVANGGTNIASYAIGDILYASASGVLSKLADVAINQVLVSGGVGAAPAYSGSPTLANLTTTTSFIGPLWKPTVDSTTAINIGNAAGTAQFIFNTTNSEFGIGKTPSQLIDVTVATNGTDGIFVTNSTSGTAGVVTLRFTSASATSELRTQSALFTTSGRFIQSHTILDAANYLDLSSAGANPIDFWSNGSKTGSIGITGAYSNVNGANGQSISYLQTLTELTTIAAAATTDTTIQMPANSVVLGVAVRVTTIIPTATTFSVGDSGAAARFSTANVSTAANSTDTGTKAGAYYNASALSIRLTMIGGTPAANTGRVRVVIYYYTVTAPTS